MMPTQQNKPSVIAKLMRFDTSPPHQQEPVYRHQRVFSDNYLQKSASIGLHEKKSSIIRQRLRTEKKSKRIEERKDLVLRPNLRNVKQESRPSFLQDSHTGWEYKKQLLERSKRTKVCQESWFIKPVCSRDETKQRLEMVNLVYISNYDGWRDNSVTKLPISKQFSSVNRSASGNTKLKNMSKGDLISSSVDPDNKASATSQAAEFSCSFDVVFGKELPCEEGFTSLNCIDVNDEAYQLSPNSVLEPDNSSSFENGLWTKLQLLKSESEENQSNRSESVVSTGQNTKPVRSLGPKESQQFSYLVNVLNEMGFQGDNAELNFETCVTDPVIFKTLEKKYENEKSWSKADRRLLFDWINLALTEVVWSKSVRRKMNNALRRDVVVDELWNMLLSQEKKVNVDLSKNEVWEESWLELRDEVDSIVVEIEAFLFNELATEFISV